MKKLFFTILFIAITLQSLYASSPLLGIAGIRGNSPRAINLSRLVEAHLSNIINSTGIFEQVNHTLLRSELTRFNCIEDSCILRFARTAKMSVIIRGEIEDRGDTIVLKLYSLGIAPPYFGSVIYSYRVEIPITGIELNAREFSYICEEHAGHFISMMIRKFKYPLYIKRDSEKIIIDYKGKLNGVFNIYRFDPAIPDEHEIRYYRRIGEVRISDNIVIDRSLNVSEVMERDFVFLSFENKACFLKDFYYGRKGEIVFDEPGISDSIYTLLFTVPASATMPIVAPILGYYKNGDFTGLSLWALNVFPYLYIEYDGLTNRPEELKDEKKTISRKNATHYYFGLYMLLFGGMPLFVDAFAHHRLCLASNYQGHQPLMGNSTTAAYLSIISGGGGHFYRGYRFWGYLYFHLDNILLYYTIREFAGEERYDSESGSYKKSSIDKKRAYTMLGVLGFVKVFEVVHVLLIKDNIKNGRLLEEEFAIQPVLYMDEERRFNFGLQYSYRFE